LAARQYVNNFTGRVVGALGISTATWRLSLNDLAEKGLILKEVAESLSETLGYTLSRVPGRGLSNVWNLQKDGKTQVAAIRTTRDRFIAFPPLEGGKKWKTLDDVGLVIVAATDSKKDPKQIEVYIFPATEVRKRFDASYAARIKEKHIVRDNFGMWLCLYPDHRPTPSSVGSGIAKDYQRVGLYAVESVLAEAKALTWSDDADVEPTAGAEDEQPTTIAQVMEQARQRVAEIAGVRVEAVKLDLKVEY
jgi:hypothetical protein